MTAPKEAKMTAPKEAWLFDSHKSSKRSQWLQSTLSELEDRTKGMMKLIEGDADTFAQRAEMYYMKRPELVSMIEDFYRAYRSLAEKYDQLKMESGDTFSNRGWFCKDWNSTDRSFESPSVVSEYMVSEVEDPESEDDQVESRLREAEVAKKKNGDLAMLTNEVVLEGRVKENLYELFTDSVDPMWEVGYPKSEAAVNRSKLREFPEKMNYYGVIYTLTEEVKHIDSEVSNIADKSSKHSEFVQSEPDVDCDSEDLLEENRKSDLLSLSFKETWTIRTKTKTAAEVSSEHFLNSSELKVYDPELGGARDESKREVVLGKMSDSDVAKLMSRVEKLQYENVKSLSSEHFMNSSELKVCDPELGEASELKVCDPELGEARDESKLKVVLEKKSDIDATKLMSRVVKLQDENVTFMADLARKDEEKSDSDATKLMSRVVKLQDENVTFMADLARKDEEKREVIRQLSLFMDMLRQENIRLRKLVKESNNKGGFFTKPLKNLKGIFGGKLFGSHHSKYQTTLVAL